MAMTDDLEARLAQAERERDIAVENGRSAFEWAWHRWQATERELHREGALRDEAESLVALAMREGLAAVEAERARADLAEHEAYFAQLNPLVGSVFDLGELLRLALKVGLEQCEAERSRADRLEAAFAAMRDRLDCEVVLEGAPGQWYCDTCDNARLLADGRVADWFASRDAVTHIPGCPLHPDAGARLLARLEAAERVAEAAGVYQADGTLASATAIYEALAAWRAAKEGGR